MQFTFSFCRYADHYTLSDLCKACTVSLVLADPGGRRSNFAGLQPLNYWDSVFESRWEHGSLHLFLSVCCLCSGLYDGLISRSEKSCPGCVWLSVRDLETSTMRRPGSELGCSVTVVRWISHYDKPVVNYTANGTSRGLIPGWIVVSLLTFIVYWNYNMIACREWNGNQEKQIVHTDPSFAERSGKKSQNCWGWLNFKPTIYRKVYLNSAEQTQLWHFVTRAADSSQGRQWKNVFKPPPPLPPPSSKGGSAERKGK